MKKTILFFSIAVMAIGLLNSCSKTRDGLGLDAINNAVQTGTWKSLKYTLTTEGEVGVERELLGSGKYLKFEKDGFIHFYDVEDEEYDKKSYNFVDTKTMVYDSDSYKIQENLAGTVSRITISAQFPEGRKTYVFDR